MMRDYVKKACSMAGKLLPAAVLGAALLVAGTGRVEGSTISCLSSGGGCSITFSETNEDNFWDFYLNDSPSFSDFRYQLEIAGEVNGGMSRPLLKLGGGSTEILRDVGH